MLNRLRGLYRRFVRQHRRIEAPGVSRAMGEMGLVLRFAYAVLIALPQGLRYMATENLAARDRVKAIFGFTGPAVRELEPGLFPHGAGTVSGMPECAITIVLPVYNTFSLLPDVLERLVRHTDLEWHLVVIEDASTDPALRPWLQAWVDNLKARKPDCVTLLLNETNQGFFRSVNAGFVLALARGDHVVLLNADAFVPEAWAGRLIRPLDRDATVASVTPLSNDAEQLSVPVLCSPLDLVPGEGDAIDALAADYSAPHLTDKLLSTVTGVLAKGLDAFSGERFGVESDPLHRL